MHGKRIFLEKFNRNSIEVVNSKALVYSNISHNYFFNE